ncbi:MAG TPA: hypothetical protein VIW21_09985 [Chthoniobacterales bacterium]
MRYRFLRNFAIACAVLVFSLVATRLCVAAPAGVLDENHPAVQAVMSVQNEITSQLLERAEVLGTAVGVDTSGNPLLSVYINRDSPSAGATLASLPREIHGVAVRGELMEEIRAMGYTGKQTPPISLGTSGGWKYDSANGYCCSGTLGAVVSIGGVQHILSCAHVLEGDTVTGGNGRIAQTGDAIIQPGLVDVECASSSAQTVATLVKKNSLNVSNTDCAIGKCVSGMVSIYDNILGMGIPSKTTLAAVLNQKVKKSGRTTGTTHSTINGLNATVKVTFTKECGGADWTKTFTGQIVVNNLPNYTFLNSGDSGSLMVEDVATYPRPIGLLFAGNTSQAFANPIGSVLTFLNATMVGH